MNDRAATVLGSVAGVAALVVAVPLALAMNVVWDYGGDAPGFEESQPLVRAVGERAEARGWLLREDGTPVDAWDGGPGRGFFVVPMLLAAAMAGADRAWGRVGSRRAYRIMLWLVLASAVPIFTQYWVPGNPGFGPDLIVLLVANAAAVVYGKSLKDAGALPARAPWLVMLAFPLTAAWGFLVSGYAPPAVIMGLVIAYAGVAVGVSGSPPSGTKHAPTRAT